MRERLKDKPQEMQQEMMRIYREEKVNPLGGVREGDKTGRADLQVAKEALIFPF